MAAQPSDDYAVELRWPTGLLGCLFPLVIASIALFGAASVNSGLADDLATRRGGTIIRLTKDATIAGVNVPIFLFALYLCWSLVRSGWRWADEIAVKATAAGLEPHRSIFVKPVAWNEVADVLYARVPNGRWTTPALTIRLRDGSSRTIRGIADDDVAGARFVAYARAAIARTGNTSGSRTPPLPR